MLELTSKDLELVKYLALPDKEIAERLHYSIGTIRASKKRIFARMNVANSVQAVIKAWACGLIEKEDIIL